MRVIFAVFLLFVFHGMVDVHAGYPRVLFEREPNNTPDEAQSFRGQARLIGSVADSDPAYFLWALDDAESDRLWTLELTGETDSHILAELFWPAESAESAVMQFGAAPAEADHHDVVLTELRITPRRLATERQQLIVPPGEHQVRLTADGNSDYRLAFIESGRVRIRDRVGPSEAGPDDGAPIQVAPGRQWFYQIDRPDYRFDLTNEEPDRLWRVLVNAELGSDIAVAIEDAEGQPMGDPAGSTPLQPLWVQQVLPAGSRLWVRSRDGRDIGRIAVHIEADGQLVEAVEAGGEETGNAGTGNAGTGIDEGAVVAGSRDEAIWLEADTPLELPLPARGRTWLAFQVDASLAAGSLDLDVIHVDGTDLDGTGGDALSVSVCLAEVGSRNTVCRDGPAERLFHELQLLPGSYHVSLQVQRRSEAGVVAVTLRPQAAPAPTRAIEPNDERDWAAPLRSGQEAAGHLRGQRSAWFDWHLTADPQLWQVAVDGQNISRLSLFRAGIRGAVAEDRRTRRSPDSGAMQLDRQWLLPGHYQIRIDGTDSDYRLSTTALGQPEPGWEREPNDSAETANLLPIGEPIRGSFHTPRDQDHFYLQSPGLNRLVFDLEPPPGGDAQLEVHWQGLRVLRTPSVEERTRFTGVLPPGEFQLQVTGSGDPDAAYRLRVDFDQPWWNDDAHPFMPTPWLALPFPDEGQYHKILGELGSRAEFLSLPVTERDREVVIHASTRRFEISDGDDTTLELQDGDQKDSWTVRLPGGIQWYLQLRSRSSDTQYRIDDPAQASPDHPPVQASLTLQAEDVAAYTPWAQRIAARLEIHNLQADPVALSVRRHASHQGWRIEGLEETIALAGDERKTLSFDLIAPPDLPDDTPLALFIGVGGSVANASARIVSGIDPVDPESPHRHIASLHGLVDLAWGALGARFVDRQSGETIDERYEGRRVSLQFLNDGMSAGGSTLEWRSEMGMALPPLELAGEGGALHAFVFNQRSGHAVQNRWREVEIRWGSEPGDLPYSKTVILDAGDGEQFFPIQTPGAARYVQIRPLSTWGGTSRTGASGTGLFRVLGQPAGALANAHKNLLDRSLGGHWIYSRPDRSTRNDFPWGSSQEHRGQRIRGRDIDVAFGFLQHRTARLETLVWIDDPDHEGELIEDLRVYTSTESPVGPWTDHGTWHLQRDDTLRAVFEFAPSAAQARYLRFVFSEPQAGDSRNWRVPGDIRAYEADALGSGRSALAYWGMDDQHGPWEPEAQGLAAVEDRSSSPAHPRPLDARITAELAEPGDVRSYRITLAEPDNTFQISLDEGMTGRLRARLVDDHGVAVPLDFRNRDGHRRADVVDLAAGEYRLDVEMPPRSIAFLWDGSGSVASHQAAIYQALGRFAQGLQPGQEVANLMPLGGPLLIRDWAEFPSEITTTLAGYANTFSSSDSEPALMLASRALERRDGEHVIFLITDAELIRRDLGVWDVLERVRPRVFALEINHGSRVDIAENRWYQHLMKAWANAGHGSYRYAIGRTDLIRGFEAGMRELRQPTRFALEVATRYQEPPRPGRLVVAAGEQPVIGAGVVHLIFDASGSMLRRMEGGRRIDVAKTIVGEVLDQRIPAQVPVALRVYGHTAAHSCETELLVAPEADNHARVRAAVAGIRAINLARTPLAASLAAVLDDLEAFEGQRRLVVMLTDGEETCDGDVAGAVEALIEEGLDVRLNIVGFHIDEIGLQADFERFAAAGGGTYFDSQDGDELVAGLIQALAADFRVIDAAGDEVVRGRVGDPAVELDAGVYELFVDTHDGEHRRSLTIEPQTTKRIELSDAL